MPNEELIHILPQTAVNVWFFNVKCCGNKDAPGLATVNAQFCLAVAAVCRAMLLSSITLGWIHQQRTRAQLKSCSYHLHRVLELGLTLQRTFRLKSTIRKKEKASLLSRECFLSSFVSAHQKELEFVAHITGSQTGFSAYLQDVSWFHFRAFRWEPVVEWSWTCPAASWHNGLSPILQQHIWNETFKLIRSKLQVSGGERKCN